MKNLIIGAGEVGTALFKIFSRFHETEMRDIEEPFNDPILYHYTGAKPAILHVAYPCASSFVKSVFDYRKQYHPQLTIIHSSLPVGMTSLCGDHVVHSPVRGRHPNLSVEMLEFPKYIGANDDDDASLAERFFASCNWKTSRGWKPEETELIKLLSNAHLGLEIAWRQHVKSLMLNSDAYRMWEQEYFDGYRRLGQDVLIRPRLSPDPIGGHCILPCISMLKDKLPNGLRDFISQSNDAAQYDESKGDLHVLEESANL